MLQHILYKIIIHFFIFYLIYEIFFHLLPSYIYQSTTIQAYIATNMENILYYLSTFYLQTIQNTKYE